MKSKCKILLIIASLALTLSLMSNTYSRYVANTTGNVDIAFANWQILVNDNDILAQNTSSIEITPTILENKNIKENTIAPSSEGYFDIEIDPSNVSDHAANKDEVVTYTDLIGAFTSGMTELIDILSVVLIVFASISLVVSCVMTGIITYVSVIERTKEIGILRALGARKRDVGNLFEAECVFIGLGSGVIGCLVAYIITIPINIIINALYPSYGIGNIADLSYVSIIILILISVALTFLSSLLPARAAARKDPVIALRSE